MLAVVVIAGKMFSAAVIDPMTATGEVNHWTLTICRTTATRTSSSFSTVVWGDPLSRELHSPSCAQKLPVAGKVSKEG